MNRIFHTRITWYQYLFLILLGLLAFYLLWTKTIIIAALCMLLIVFGIERFIHTTYTITPQGELILYKGRFSRPKTILTKDIVSVDKRYIMKIGAFYATSYLLICSVDNKYTPVWPVKEREFIEAIEKQQQKTVQTTL